jgi:hypothetical protein
MHVIANKAGVVAAAGAAGLSAIAGLFGRGIGFDFGFQEFMIVMSCCAAVFALLRPI